MRAHLPVAAFGVALGVVLSASGVTDADELQRMFTLGAGHGGPRWGDLRLLVCFAAAAVLAIAGFRLVARDDDIPARPVRPWTIPGAVLFGIGWALAGACPSTALVQLGEGKLEAVVVLAFILAGAWLHDALRRRLGSPRHSCTE